MPTTPNPAKTSERRRRLLRGFTAPAVMTICSGSAFAAASNLRCIANNATVQPEVVVSSDPASAVWVRAPLYTKDGIFYVKGSEVGLRTRLSSQSVFRLTATSYNLADNQMDLPLTDQLDPTPNKVLVRFDENGYAVGFGDIQEGSFPVGTSCWTSFAVP
jgi:hypothetical protein